MELRGKVVGRGTADISRCSSFTYYANLAWAVVILTIGRLYEATHPVLTVIGAVLLIALLLRASHVQWKYFTTSLKNTFLPDDK